MCKTAQDFDSQATPRAGRLKCMTRNTYIGVMAALAAVLIGSSWQLASRHGVTTTLGPLELAVLRYGVPAAWARGTVLRSSIHGRRCCCCRCWQWQVRRAC